MPVCQPAEIRMSQDPERRQPARILTIEDDPSVRAGIVAYLEDSGY